MKILVCISNVPDTTTKIKLAEGNASIDTAGIQWVINPWDELSLTRALELKDDQSTGVRTVTVAHVGPASSEPTIRKALAIGADDAIRVNADSADAYYVAAQLAEVIRKEQFDIIMCGIESSDFNGSTVGGMICRVSQYAICIGSLGNKFRRRKSGAGTRHRWRKRDRCRTCSFCRHCSERDRKGTADRGNEGDHACKNKAG